MAVITDRRIQACGAGDVMHYEAQVVSVSDYYPFGMGIKEREWKDSSFGYRYGFNGKEQDDEVAGEGNSYDFGARIYDSRLGRFTSRDFYWKLFPDISPYSFGLNSPIIIVDENGDKVKITTSQESPDEPVLEMLRVINDAFGGKLKLKVYESSDLLRVELGEDADGNAYTEDDLNEQELATYKLMKEMTDPNNPKIYNLHPGTSSNNGSIDDWGTGELFTKGMDELPVEGQFNKLYCVYHFLHEQKLKQEDVSSKYMTSSNSDIANQDKYIEQCDATTDEQVKIFKFKMFGLYQGTSEKVTRWVIVDPKGQYLTTMVEDGTGDKNTFTYFVEEKYVGKSQDDIETEDEENKNKEMDDTEVGTDSEKTSGH